MIENQPLTTANPDEAPVGRPRPAHSRSDENGAVYYGIITIGAIAGSVLGIVTGNPILGLFTGMGAGFVGAICVAAGKEMVSLFRST